MRKANAMQIGGSHYAAKHQHWDLIAEYGVGYLEGNASKYVTRWRRKNGVQDLRKALHYVNKILEIATHQDNPYPGGGRPPATAVRQFCDANSLVGYECYFMKSLLMWQTIKDLYDARSYLEKMIEVGLITPYIIRPDNTGQKNPFGYDHKNEHSAV